MSTRARQQPAPALHAAQCRAQMLGAARRFFAAHGILEVDTPALSPSAVSDPHIESVQVALAADASRAYFLRTSPEFAMKRLLCAGWPDIYQVCRVFRDGECGRRHQPEFTLVEWYRRGLSLHDMMAHTVDFLNAVLEPRRLPAPAVHLRYVDAFTEHAGVHPLDSGLDALTAAAGADAGLEGALGTDREAWLDLLLADRVAPRFARDRLTVLHHYPAAQAALARRCPGDARLADRFEVFLGDIELANGYYELADAAEQRRRWQADQARRRARGQPVRPLDETLLDALARGLPDCCGVAVGFERLVMINCDSTDIRDVVPFAFAETDHD